MVTGVVTGAMGSLLPKLGRLLAEEYNLQKSVKKEVEALWREMKSIHAALRKVAEVPRDRLDEQAKIWADEVRELSYNMEDVVDTFLVRVDDDSRGESASASSSAPVNSDKLKLLAKRMRDLFKKLKARRHIAIAIRDIKKEVQAVASRHGRYTVDNVVVAEASPTAAVTTIDPRLRALYTEATELVGVHEKTDREIVELLSLEDDDGTDSACRKKLKVVSITGFGGLGKTTLAKAVYDKIKGGFDCWAFVPVGRGPGVKKVFRDILIGVDKQKYTNINLNVLNEMQLIEELRDFLENKRYLIIIDDIWDAKLWEDIKLAFSNRNNLGSRLITTTRIVSVSKACCSSIGDSIYQMKPLTEDDSKRLFYKRIFSSENSCPSELEEVSRDILKKCGGVPLTIITIASLLASGTEYTKPKDEWHALLRSIGRGLMEDASMEEMQRILSFSYYDLPSHLKTCLLYLSIYPEDWQIDRNQLIWKWVAENLVQCEKQGTSLFEIGKTYFYELVNRSMIQPVYNYGGFVISCRVHDMVLDLICSLSTEENFVTILDDVDGKTMYPKSNVRRLSLQNRKKDQQTIINSMSMSQVRSITVFPPAVSLIPDLSSFNVLRVLDLGGCDLAESGGLLNLRGIGRLYHLRYLGLRNSGICELPAEIGNLQFLQVLDLRYNNDLRELPSTVFKLKRLLFLNVDNTCRWLSDGLGNLTSIESLKNIVVSPNTVQELGKLALLRELEITFNNDDDESSLELEEAFVESLSNLHNVQYLSFSPDGCFESTDLLAKCWDPPPHLRVFNSYVVWSRAIAFPALPAWIKRNHPLYLNLRKLRICVRELGQEDVQIVGRLPALCHLWIRKTGNQLMQTERSSLVISGGDGFRRVKCFALYCGLSAQILFEPGALPMAERVRFDLAVRLAAVKKQVDDGGDGRRRRFEVGLGNLVSLRHAAVWIGRGGVTVGEAREAEAALLNALHAHRNRPTTEISMEPPILQGAKDDDLYETR